MRSVPVYVKVTNTELEERVAEIATLATTLGARLAFLGSKAMPTLYGVSAPEDDYIAVGDIVVCGVSSLSEEKKVQLGLFIKALLNDSQEPESAELGKL